MKAPEFDAVGDIVNTLEFRLTNEAEGLAVKDKVTASPSMSL